MSACEHACWGVIPWDLGESEVFALGELVQLQVTIQQIVLGLIPLSRQWAQLSQAIQQSLIMSALAQIFQCPS